MKKLIILISIAISTIIFARSCSSSDMENEVWQEAYITFLKDYSIPANNDSYFSLKDMNHNGIPELLIVEVGGREVDGVLSVYSYDSKVYKIGTYSNPKIGVAALCTSNNPMYPGLFTTWWGGGIEHYGYLTVLEGELVYEELWYIDRTKDSPYTNELSSDKQLINESMDALSEHTVNLLDMYPINDSTKNKEVINLYEAEKLTEEISYNEVEAEHHEDEMAFHEDETAFHEDETAFHEDEMAFHEDEMAFHEDEKAFHEDEKAFQKDEKTFHKDEKAFHEDEKEFHVDNSLYKLESFINDNVDLFNDYFNIVKITPHPEIPNYFLLQANTMWWDILYIIISKEDDTYEITKIEESAGVTATIAEFVFLEGFNNYFIVFYYSTHIGNGGYMLYDPKSNHPLYDIYGVFDCNHELKEYPEIIEKFGHAEYSYVYRDNYLDVRHNDYNGDGYSDLEFTGIQEIRRYDGFDKKIKDTLIDFSECRIVYRYDPEENLFVFDKTMSATSEYWNYNWNAIK